MIVEGDGEANETITYLEYRKCTDEDWAHFYEPSRKYEAHFWSLKQKGHLNCLTGKDVSGNEANFDLFGQDENAPHRRIEFSFLPCTPK
jgi:hypothetical protein